MKFLLLIIGKTSSGKDISARYLKEKYDIKEICSYTTREMREYEKDGVEHYFVSQEKIKEIMETESLIGYTKFPKTGIEYCATVESIPKGVSTYIIDPKGFEYLKRHCNIPYATLYVDLSEEKIIERALLRGDNKEKVLKRLDSERKMFDSFRDSKQYDYYVDNSKDLKDLYSYLDNLVLWVNTKANDIYSHFLYQYHVVFNQEDNIKLCSRENTSRLIDLANEIEDRVDFGNADTGYINIYNIKRLYHNISRCRKCKYSRSKGESLLSECTNSKSVNYNKPFVDWGKCDIGE